MTKGTRGAYFEMDWNRRTVACCLVRFAMAGMQNLSHESVQNNGDVIFSLTR